MIPRTLHMFVVDIPSSGQVLSCAISGQDSQGRVTVFLFR